MATNKSNQIAFSDISKQVDEATSGADAHRADRLDHLLVARKAKETGLTREQARLTKKLGADHARVAAIADRRTANAGLRRDLALESVRARTEIPKVDDTTWALLGVVRDADLKPVASVTVALYDAGGRVIDNLGYACTDRTGRFRIEATNVKASGPPVFARVTTADGTLLAVDRTPLHPAGGTLDYREITVSDATKPCPPPAPPPATPDAWVVRGRVTDKAGAGLSGLTVSVFDKDLIFDDRLGETKTDKDGQYSFTYRTEQFRDLIESKPDLYVKVADASGKTLYSSKGAIRYAAGRIETINVQIEPRKT